MINLTYKIHAAAIAMSLAGTAIGADISGAGATFPYPIYAKWADAYKKQTGNGLNYQSIGSGGGIAQIKAKTVTFGASDMPLKPGDLDAAGLTQFPAIIGGEVLIANLPGIKPGEIVIDGPTIADIFLGKITSWDDIVLKKLNPKVNLPHKAIAVVHRSDGSGTTFVFTNYLSKVSPAWKDQVGESTSVEWPVGLGGKGNEGVAGTVTQTDGSVGYVEYAYAVQNKMTYMKMINRAGSTLEPGTESFQAAAANADWEKAPGFYQILTDQPGKGSWPITGASFIIVHKVPDNPGNVLAALKFYDWAFKHGQKMAEDLVYIPLPAPLVNLIEKSWINNIKTADGKAVWTK